MVVWFWNFHSPNWHYSNWMECPYISDFLPTDLCNLFSFGVTGPVKSTYKFENVWETNWIKSASNITTHLIVTHKMCTLPNSCHQALSLKIVHPTRVFAPKKTLTPKKTEGNRFEISRWTPSIYKLWFWNLLVTTTQTTNQMLS